ncbi:MAG: homoserine O-succinyltransferase [Oscillospiraceae bacterium]|nr:homoserine O-succinyltransferase [Oscillospiraceae bacterium]
MPINIPHALPAFEALEKENIFVMDQNRAMHQDIRPLSIAIYNLMPSKIDTETQLLRVLGNTSLQIDITLINPSNHYSKNTPIEHLEAFYQSFDDVRNNKFDGLIITGAPVETMDFEEIDYWDEMKEIMDWSKKNVFSTLYICWGAMAGLYYHYGIKKYITKEKVFGVFSHIKTKDNVKLLRGFDDVFYVPHSRHTEIREEEIDSIGDIELLSKSPEAGVYIVSSKDGRQIFVIGHGEYDNETLRKEYLRDKNKGLEIQIPKNYFKDDDPSNSPIVTWRSHGNLLYQNWLNYYVYQETPYDLKSIH